MRTARRPLAPRRALRRGAPWLILALVALVAPAVRAQVGFLPYTGYNARTGAAEVGVGLTVGRAVAPGVALALRPSFDVALGELNDVEFDVDLVASLGRGRLVPQVGVGLQVLTREVVFVDPRQGGGGFPGPSADTIYLDSMPGLNVLGGLELDLGARARPYVQGRHSTSGPDAFTLEGGLVVGF